MRWILCLIAGLSGCASTPPASPSLPSTPDEALQALVGTWDTRWRQDELLVTASLADGRVTLRRASPRDPSLPLPRQAPDTLGQHWIAAESGNLTIFDPNSSHSTVDELCYEGPGTWMPCGYPEAGWRFRFVTPDLIHIGEPGAPRAVLSRR